MGKVGLEGMSEERKEQRPFPADYHDYVIKDGKLTGDFENMYRYSEEIPWHQDTCCNHWSAQVGMLMLQHHSPYDTILEIGCGLGYIAARLKNFAKENIDAFDISPEAIRKARNFHPGIQFYVDDISQASFQPKQRYDLVVVRDIFWYVFPQMEVVVRNINACIKPQGFFFISQSFPALNQPFVGKEAIPHPEALIAYFPNYDPLDTAVFRNHRLVENGTILHFLGV